MTRATYPRFITDSIAFSSPTVWCVWQSGTTHILFRTEDREKAVALAARLNAASVPVVEDDEEDNLAAALLDTRALLAEVRALLDK